MLCGLVIDYAKMDDNLIYKCLDAFSSKGNDYIKVVSCMVDKISGNSSYDYPNSKDARKKPALQAYEKTSDKKEAAKQKASAARRTGSLSQDTSAAQKGVILDLSSKEKKQTIHEAVPSWQDALRRFFAPVIAWIKKFWESEDTVPADPASGQADMAAISDGSTDDLQKDAEIPSSFADTLPPLDEVNEIPDYASMLDDAVKSRDMHKLEQLLTQNGTKHLAHHSDLLTYYDRWGKLVELDDTAKHRVLFGDKNILKL